MKPRKKPWNHDQEALDKIGKFFEEDHEKCSVILTLLGMGALMSDYLSDEFSSVDEVLQHPIAVQYSIIQMAQFLTLFRGIMQDETDNIPLQSKMTLHKKYLRTNQTSWRSAEDFEERIDFLLTAMVEERKKK